MATLTIEIDKERDLPILQEFLTRMGLKFEVEDDEDWGGLPEEAIKGIKAGLEDVEASRVHSHESVMAELKRKITNFRSKNA